MRRRPKRGENLTERGLKVDGPCAGVCVGAFQSEDYLRPSGLTLHGGQLCFWRRLIIGPLNAIECHEVWSCKVHCTHTAVDTQGKIRRIIPLAIRAHANNTIPIAGLDGMISAVSHKLVVETPHHAASRIEGIRSNAIVQYPRVLQHLLGAKYKHGYESIG